VFQHTRKGQLSTLKKTWFNQGLRSGESESLESRLDLGVGKQSQKNVPPHRDKKDEKTEPSTLPIQGEVRAAEERKRKKKPYAPWEQINTRERPNG